MFGSIFAIVKTLRGLGPAVRKRTMTGIAPPELAHDPSSHDFNALPIGGGCAAVEPESQAAAFPEPLETGGLRPEDRGRPGSVEAGLMMADRKGSVSGIPVDGAG